MKRVRVTAVSIFLFFVLANNLFAGRILTVVSDLNHKNKTIGTFRALIIGIQNYNDPKIPDLQTPLKDANDISEVLQNKYGFKVETLLDDSATKKAMYRALRNLSSIAKPDDSILIYYAGHGEFDRQYDDGWWIPVDAIGGESVTYLDNIQIQKAMRSMKAKHVLLISDSCYSGTLFGLARAMPSVIYDKYYLNLYNEKSRWGMTSGNKTPVSDSGTGGNSVFAYQLIKKLQSNDKPFMSTQEIYTDIAPIIANNSEQTPLCRPIKGTGDQGGEFIFVSTVNTNQNKPDTISEPKIAAPESKKVTFDDIIKLEHKQQVIKQKWQEWQKDREDEYSQVQLLDKSTSLSVLHKKKAWLRFSSGVSQNNPFSKQDDEMRFYAEQRISHWETQLINKKQITKQETRLEQERKEQNSLELEHKRLEDEKKKLQQKKSIKLASIIPDKQPQILIRDGQYVKYKKRIVYDEASGLEWVVGPDLDYYWKESKYWVENLNLDEGGWRMPSRNEIRKLYKKGLSSRNMTSLLGTTDWWRLSDEDWWVWSREKKGPSYAWLFNFATGKEEYYYLSSRKDRRAFAVRSRKK